MQRKKTSFITHLSKLSSRVLLMFIIISLCPTFTSCDKLPANGLLDGHWQLMTIQTPDSLRNVPPEQVFISIQLELAQWQNYRTGKYYYSHFEHRGDSLLFFDLAYPSDHSLTSNNDEWIPASELDNGLLSSWGIHTSDTRYRIQNLSNTALVLEKADTLLHFRKF